jgi:DNA processing protein
MYKEQLSDEEIGAWLAFHVLPKQNLGSRTIYLLLERFQFSALDLFNAEREELRSIDPDNFPAPLIDYFISERQKLDPEKLLAEVRKTPDVGILAFGDWNYPPCLRHVSAGQAPWCLFYRGNLTPLSFNGIVGVVGTRNPSAYGQRIAKDVARGLAENAAVVASGLAIGVDSLAHWGAIEGGGKTIAVVATGPDLCYPSSNKRLYNAIIEGNGLVISEYLPGTHAEKWHFPARNRIISGISTGVVVVEAGKESGALITARIASEDSRAVFAFPGRIDSPTSEGTNKLIQSTKAMLVTNHFDILHELGWVKARINDTDTIVELYGNERTIYDMLSAEPTHFDVLCERSGLSVGEMSAALTMLELAGLVGRHPGDWYSRAAQLKKNAASV